MDINDLISALSNAALAQSGQVPQRTYNDQIYDAKERAFMNHYLNRRYGASPSYRNDMRRAAYEDAVMQEHNPLELPNGVGIERNHRMDMDMEEADIRNLLRYTR